MVTLQNVQFTKLNDGGLLINKEEANGQSVFWFRLSAADVTNLNTELGLGGVAPPGGSGEANPTQVPHDPVT